MRPDIQIADSILSEGGAGATASTTSLRALQNRLGSVNRCSRDAVLLKTRGGDPQLVSCKVAGRSHDVRESCRRANMEEKTASTAVSSHEIPSLVPTLNTRATRLGAHNPVCDSCMCDWLTGRHGRARWQPVELPCITQSTFTTTIPHFLPYLCFVSAFESVDRCLSSACRRQSAADLADHASLEAPRFFGRFTPRDGPRTAHQQRGLSMKK